jgi:sugar O-acyltransferase (sialic acid O-acetyltransferase NeuD family)
MSNTLYIYGYGGFGKEIFDIAKRTKKFDTIKFIDDNSELANGRDIMTFDELMSSDQSSNGKFIIGIGDPFVRRKIINKLIVLNFDFANVICPTAIISPFSSIGKGVLVCSFCIIGPNSVINDHVVLNIQAIVGHDIQVGENCVLSSQVNIGGGSILGFDTYIGMASIVKEGLIVGNRSVLGMGSALYRNLDAGLLALGNPARSIRKIDDNFKVF